MPDEIKPCRYCDDKPDVLILNNDCEVTLEPNGYIYLKDCYGESDRIKANYCPICGRHL